MYADSSEDIWIGLSQDNGHGCPRRQSRNESPVLCDTVGRADLLHDTGEDCRLTRIAALIPAAEPVPARLRVVAPRLGGVNHDEAVLFGQTVHASACGKILRRLRAAVQHDDNTTGTIRSRRRNIGAKASTARRAGECIVEKAGT